MPEMIATASASDIRFAACRMESPSGTERQPARSLLESERHQQRRERARHRRPTIDLLESKPLDPPAADLIDQRLKPSRHAIVVCRNERLQRAPAALQVKHRLAA